MYAKYFELRCMFKKHLVNVGAFALKLALFSVPGLKDEK